MKWTAHTHAEGLRTWFGTLTFTPEEQRDAVLDARSVHPTPNAAWWEEAHCDERFKFVRKEMVGMVQRYWKRLRKGAKRCVRCFPKKPRAAGEWDHPPAKFKYLLVFERHKSGLPHIHWLVHECEAPILLKQLSCAWPHGFTKVKLVKGDDIKKAGFYVSKYLGKSVQARQIASTNYAKTEGLKSLSKGRERAEGPRT